MLLNLGCCVEMQLLSWPGHAASKGKKIYKKKCFHSLIRERRAGCLEHKHLLYIRLNLLPNSHQGANCDSMGPPHSHALWICPSLPAPREKSRWPAAGGLHRSNHTDTDGIYKNAHKTSHPFKPRGKTGFCTSKVAKWLTNGNNIFSIWTSIEWQLWPGSPEFSIVKPTSIQGCLKPKNLTKTVLDRLPTVPTITNSGLVTQLDVEIRWLYTYLNYWGFF